MAHSDELSPIQPLDWTLVIRPKVKKLKDEALSAITESE